ncbi:MAG TPA: GNAT family N-acetyltransferase [Candidatus Acidoferrales bacterium]|nr:GNAT family N-acetyltransferase [Candidatus Acidoferrales bacterium]
MRAHADHFLLLVEQTGKAERGAGERVLGCVALEPYGADLAEIRSLAVTRELRGSGLGARLVRTALARARRRKFSRVFAVTHAPEFFVRQGFSTSARQDVPEKVQRDCVGCPKARKCKLVAVIAQVSREQVLLPVVAELTA